MAYDLELADGIRALVGGIDGVTEKKMFGGLAFLVGGNMAVAASGQGGILVRADPEKADEWIDGEHVAPMEMRGREMKGWLRVDAETAEKPAQLQIWVDRGVAYAQSLPVK
jgi:TfoX/Sxy family transcriptional regulator of competence genes